MSAPGPGPPYPRYPSGQAPGQNAIGQFAIGESPIGTIIPFDYWQTIISQYGNSTVITTLVGFFDTWLDQTQNLDTFYDDIWNVATAQGYGLDVWGRIVGVVRTVSLAAPQYFGFLEQNLTTQPFGVGGTGLIYTFYAGTGPLYNGETIATNYSMTDSQFRTLIFAKALFNITNGSIASINAILRALFATNIANPFYEGFSSTNSGFPPGFGPPNPVLLPGNCYVQDNLNMSMTYVFDFPLTPLQIAVITQSNVLPAPTGVRVTFMQVGVAPNVPIQLQSRARGPAIKARAATTNL